MSSKYVVGADGHVLSEDEREQATEREAPVSTEGAPDTRVEHIAAVSVERNQRLIRTYERRIKENQAELATAGEDEWLRTFLQDNIALNQRRVAELQTEIQKAQGMSM
jgi:hypothetical protein